MAISKTAAAAIAPNLFCLIPLTRYSALDIGLKPLPGDDPDGSIAVWSVVLVCGRVGDSLGETVPVRESRSAPGSDRIAVAGSSVSPMGTGTDP